MKPFLCSRMILFVFALAFVQLLSAAEIVKWVDEHGKVHYGDKVPEKYQDVAEEVDTDTVSVVSPEQEVRAANQQHVDKLKLQDAREESREARQARQRELTERKSQNAQRRGPMTREECRNRYVKRVAARTRCFKRADAYYSKDK